MTEVPIIKKPFHWFSEQIKGPYIDEIQEMEERGRGKGGVEQIR